MKNTQYVKNRLPREMWNRAANIIIEKREKKIKNYSVNKRKKTKRKMQQKQWVLLKRIENKNEMKIKRAKKELSSYKNHHNNDAAAVTQNVLN